MNKETIRICGDLKALLDRNERRIEDTATKVEEDEFEPNNELELSHEQQLDAVA